MRSSEDELNKLRSQITQLNSEKSSLTIQLERSNYELTAAKDRLQTMEQDNRKLQQEVQTLTNQNRDLTYKVSSLESEKLSLNNSLSQLKVQNEDLRAQVEALRRQVSELEQDLNLTTEECQVIVRQMTFERNKLMEDNHMLQVLCHDRLVEIEKKSFEYGCLLLKIALAYAEVERLHGVVSSRKNNHTTPTKVDESAMEFVHSERTQKDGGDESIVQLD